MDFSKNLQLLRKEAGLSQEEVAEKLHLSRQAVSKWESAQALPDIGTCIKLCEILNVTPNRLMGIEEPQAAVEQENKPPKGNAFLTATIFLMAVLVCGTVLITFNLYNGINFEPLIHVLALFMIVGSQLSFIIIVLRRLIKRRKAAK